METLKKHSKIKEIFLERGVDERPIANVMGFKAGFRAVIKAKDHVLFSYYLFLSTLINP